MLIILLPTISLTNYLNIGQQFNLISEIISDLKDTVKALKKWLFSFNLRKTSLVSFD